jgi:gas vesicle protein
VALLLAPNAGKKTRRKLIRGLSQAREEASGRWDDISDDVRSAVEAGRKKVRI